MYENHSLSWGLYFFMALGLAIHHAAEQGKVDVVHYLLNQGADPSIKDTTERTALDWAE
ncbi:hypothetical protein BDW59DRAFT_139266 [Aspergillus cavernicola]|uniref:Ankyrin repeat-containing domain protein n=1 Tax=Aspergillus cavernicola TaxID=176166 RepID=A0ABR4IXJ7_9EURO